MNIGRCAKPKFQRRGPLLAVLAVLSVFCSVANPSKALTDGQFWHDTNTGLALGGFDPVSYFADAKPRHGTEELEHVWQRSAFRFSSTGNLQAFIRDPEVYAPRLGGYGVVAMARGNLSAGNPSLWAIVRGRLYLFHTLENKLRFEREQAELLEKAEDQWKRHSK